jgi:hypothetical protein
MFQRTMWNKMKLTAQIKIAQRGREGWGEREIYGAPKSNFFTSGSPVANLKSCPDYSVYHEIIHIFF